MARRLVLTLSLALGLWLGTANAGVLGDTSGNGRVDVRDATLILQADVGLLPVSYLVAENADIDADGRITVIDAALILQFSAGIIDGF